MKRRELLSCSFVEWPIYHGQSRWAFHAQVVQAVRDVNQYPVFRYKDDVGIYKTPSRDFSFNEFEALCDVFLRSPGSWWWCLLPALHGQAMIVGVGGERRETLIRKPEPGREQNHRKTLQHQSFFVWPVIVTMQYILFVAVHSTLYFFRGDDRRWSNGNTQRKHIVRMCLDRPVLLSITHVSIYTNWYSYIYIGCFSIGMYWLFFELPVHMHCGMSASGVWIGRIMPPCFWYMFGHANVPRFPGTRRDIKQPNIEWWTAWVDVFASDMICTYLHPFRHVRTNHVCWQVCTSKHWIDVCVFVCTS